MVELKRKQAVPVRLDDYFNWKGVSWPERQIAGRLDPHGSSLPGEAIPNDTVIAIRDVAYRIPKTDSPADDLISCEGQRIQLTCPMQAQRVHVLGFSVFGDYAEHIDLIYERGGVPIEASVPFGMSDWIQYMPGKPAHFGEEAGIVLPYYLDDEGTVDRQAALWVQRIAVDPAMKLHGLRLPENPFIYIMAITLIAS